MLDTDWYKLTMRYVIARYYPNAIAQFRFINRGKHEFPEGFLYALQEQVEGIADLSLTDNEQQWAETNDVGHVVNDRLKYDKDLVVISQKDNDLDVRVIGHWSESSLWEVPLMSTIAELYYKMTGRAVTPGFIQRMDNKATCWIDQRCKWSDFGTRRRYSYSVQDELNNLYRHYQPYFLGTSNPHFAMKYNLPVLGTYAHEAPMAMQVLANPKEAFHEDEWLDKFSGCFGEENTLVLGDTLGLKRTLQYSASLGEFGGFRIDSGDPMQMASLIMQYYKDHQIPTKDKTLLFSDSLTTSSSVALANYCANKWPDINVKFGIGTHLTNDVGLTPMNMVIKMSHIATGDGDPFQSVVKISDTPGKESGEPETITRLKEKFKIV